MRVLAAYGLQFGRYRITKIAKQKNKYGNTNSIVLDVWHGVLLAAPGVAHLGEGPPVAAIGCMADVCRIRGSWGVAVCWSLGVRVLGKCVCVFVVCVCASALACVHV